MCFLKTVIAAAILGGVAQSGLSPTGRPGQGPSEKSDAATLRAAENVFGSLQSDVRKELETLLQTSDITSRDLGGLVAQLDSSAVKLKEAGFDEKLNRAIQKAETMHTQALSVLKDPGNKEVLGRDLHPDDYLREIQYQRATGAILERNIQRLRTTTDEMRKYAVIMEGVMPSDQLSPRLKERLAQLLREWQSEPENNNDRGQGFAAESKEENRKIVPNRTQNRPKELTGEPGPKPAHERISTARQVELSGAAEKVMRMSRQEVSERSILKFIASSAEPFALTRADQIIKLRDQGVSNDVINAMLRHDEQLPMKTLSKR